MSACGYKQTSRGLLANVRFTPESGHSAQARATHSISTRAANPNSLTATVALAGIGRCIRGEHRRPRLRKRARYSEPSASCTSPPVRGGTKVQMTRMRVMARIRWRSWLFIAYKVPALIS